MPIAEAVGRRRAWGRDAKAFLAEVREFKGFVGAREEVMDDRICI